MLRVMMCALAAAAAACTPRAVPGVVEPGLEQRIVEDARPHTDRFVLFNWSLREGQSRFSGAGSARIAADYRARLDLFGPMDVPYLSAILREGRLVLPPGVPARVVPPAPLLWSALGVVRPPAGAHLVRAESDDDEATLAYDSDDGVWTFRTRSGALVAAEWRAADGAHHTVELTGAVSGQPPQRALYRDWQEFRELEIELEETEEVDGFPPDTWTLEAR